MTRHTLAGGLAGVAMLALLAVPGSAQEMSAGLWSGSISSPEGESFEVHYEVVHGEEGLEIAIIPPAGLAPQDRYEFSGIELEDGLLTFGWSPELDVWLDCALDLHEEGFYEGECVAEDGESGILKMVPPDKGDPPTGG